MREAVVLAGGLGSRLRPVVNDLPKPMAPVAGKPFLAWLLSYIRQQGVQHVILSVCYKSEVIKDYFGRHYDGLEISYEIESTPQGTGGAVRDALKLTKTERIFVLNGDSICDIGLASLRAQTKQEPTAIGILVHQVPDVARYGAIELDALGRVRTFTEKGKAGSGFINAGVYDLPRSLLELFPSEGCFSLESFLIGLSRSEPIIGVPTGEFFIDIGIPEDYTRAQELIPKWFPKPS